MPVSDQTFKKVMAILKPYSEWSDLELVIHARDFLLKQNEQSIGDFADCAYLAPNGCMCGAGLFLKGVVPGHTLLAMRGIVCDSEVSIVFRNAGFTMDQINGPLRSIQVIHDAIDPTQWACRFEQLIKETT
jgi:hypothetical protein